MLHVPELAWLVIIDLKGNIINFDYKEKDNGANIKYQFKCW